MTGAVSRVTAAVAVLLVAAAAPAARAQDATLRIAVVDVQRVLNEARSAKTVRKEIDAVHKDFQEKVREQERELRAAAKKLNDQRVLLSSDEFSRRRLALEEEGRRMQTAVRERRQTLDRAFVRARNVIMENLGAVTAQVSKTRDIDIVLERGNVFFTVGKLDLTPELIALLDKRLPEVKLQFEEPGGDKGKK